VKEVIRRRNETTQTAEGRPRKEELVILTEIFTSSRTPEDAFFGMLKYVMKYTITNTDHPVHAAYTNFQNSSLAATMMAPILCILTFAATVAATACLAYLALDSNALPTDSTCGIWVPNTDNSVANPLGRIMTQVESYYSGCYEAEPSQQNCDIFPEKNLHRKEVEGTDCLFTGDVCLDEVSSIILDTEYLNFETLGINSPFVQTFRRRTECSVLKTDAFQEFAINNATNYTTIRFYLGRNNIKGNNFTYEQIRSARYEKDFSPTGYQWTTLSESSQYVGIP
jgi:hypothetical protein